jgi:hypothetical protein
VKCRHEFVPCLDFRFLRCACGELIPVDRRFWRNLDHLAATKNGPAIDAIVGDPVSLWEAEPQPPPRRIRHRAHVWEASDHPDVVVCSVCGKTTTVILS